MIGTSLWNVSYNREEGGGEKVLKIDEIDLEIGRE